MNMSMNRYRRQLLAALLLCAGLAQANAQDFVDHAADDRVRLEQSLRQARAEWRAARERGDAQAVDNGLLINAFGDRREILVTKIIERGQASRKAGVRVIDEELRVLSTRRNGRLLLAEVEYARNYTHPLYGDKAVPSKSEGMAVYIEGLDGQSGRWYFPAGACFTADDVLKHPERFFHDFDTQSK